MKLRIWGSRGSLPVALDAGQLRGKIADALMAANGRTFAGRDDALEFLRRDVPFHVGAGYGGNSSCVQVDTGQADEYLLCDAGSGLRAFGVQVMRERAGKPATFHILMSHPHWDHIMGFPFFTPSFIPGNRIVFHGCHDNLAMALQRQHGGPSFPVPWAALGATIEFAPMVPGVPVSIAGATVTAKHQLHEGDSYGYRIEQAGRALVYSTDSEHKLDDFAETEGFVEFFRGADVVVFDAMYSLADAISLKEDWGHSSNVVGVELCQLAGVGHLVLFHHEPTFDDAQIAATLAETLRFEAITREGRPPLQVSAAYDGMELDV